MSVTAEHDRLERIEVELGDLVRRFAADVALAAPADQVDASFGSFADRMQQTVDRLMSLNGELHEDDFDPRALAEFRGILIETIQAATQADPDRPLDAVDSLLVHAEQLRHIVRDALDGHVEGVTVSEVLTEIRQWLPDARLRDLAVLLDRSERQIQRWSSSQSVAPRRLRLVVRLVALLRHGWTAQGIVAWFSRPRSDLGGRAPIEVLDDPGREADLLAAARRGRAQHGG